MPGLCKLWFQEADYPGWSIDEFRLPCLGTDDLDELAFPHIIPGDVLIAGPSGMRMVEEPVLQTIQNRVFPPAAMTVVQDPTAFHDLLDGMQHTPILLVAPHGAAPGNFTGCLVGHMKPRSIL